MKLSQELAYRGFVNQTTYKDAKALDGPQMTFYWGVDPSADSMTVGNLAIAMMVRQLINYGHKAVLLVGGATGLIGDPDGKASERELQTEEQLAANKKAIAEHYKRLFAGQDFEIVDNYDWFKKMNYLDFLRETGKNVPMRQMLGREFVQTRLSDTGISYAEFSYALIQAYDFLYLFKEKNVTLQVCGADQWGNCIAGVDLVRRVTGQEVNVWSAPLVVNKSTGVKFGKSEDGAVWLDASKTSPYQFYQFWLNTDDASVEDFLKIYTTLERRLIEKVMAEFHLELGARLAQKTLAYEITKLVHGEEVAQSVQNVSEVLFGRVSFLTLEPAEQEMLKRELTVVSPSPNLAITLASSGLATSASDARRLIKSGAVRINGQKIDSDEASFQPGANLLKCGKNNFAVVEN